MPLPKVALKTVFKKLGDAYQNQSTKAPLTELPTKAVLKNGKQKLPEKSEGN